MYKTYICTYLCPKKTQTVQLIVQNRMGGSNFDHLEYQTLLSCSLQEKGQCRLKKSQCPAVESAKIKRLCLEQM